MLARNLFCALSVTLLAGSAGGCAYGELRTVLRAQFASELDCPEVQIERRELWYSYDGPDQYKISGCGVMRTYTCPNPEGLVSYDEPQCEWVEGDADAPQIKKLEDSSVLDEAADDDTSAPAAEEEDEEAADEEPEEAEEKSED
ncbi:MAG: hypothetical protein OXT09_21345 [Myxococcales bacterium]|nr:hypothetical protein [Myxococcales bacterium]